MQHGSPHQPLDHIMWGCPKPPITLMTRIHHRKTAFVSAVIHRLGHRVSAFGLTSITQRQHLFFGLVFLLECFPRLEQCHCYDRPPRHVDPRSGGHRETPKAAPKGLESSSGHHLKPPPVLLGSFVNLICSSTGERYLSASRWSCDRPVCIS